MKKEIFEKIIKKKELSLLPRRDVEKAFSHFERRQVSDTERVRLTRELLHKVFGAFGSRKLFTTRQRDSEWFLKKHLSTRERLPYYEKVYGRILDSGKITIFDLGAGINGLSYNFFEEKPKYVAVEAVGQLVSLMNNYFEKEKINGKAVHLSLFELEKLKALIRKQRGKKFVFLFKIFDSLEILERDYSKKLLLGIAPLAERIVVSFATESMIRRRRFDAKRSWLVNFIRENFKILDDFSLGGERYLVFKKK